MDHDCCGIAGTYGLKKEKYDDRDGRRRAAVREGPGERSPEAACDSETCRWQIEKATGTRTRHPIEILLQAYRIGDVAGGTESKPAAPAVT